MPRNNRKTGTGGHQRGHQGRTDARLTPPEILLALGPWDLDPCAPYPDRGRWRGSITPVRVTGWPCRGRVVFG